METAAAIFAEIQQHASLYICGFFVLGAKLAGSECLGPGSRAVGLGFGIVDFRARGLRVGVWIDYEVHGDVILILVNCIFYVGDQN